jgi:GYF domain 2
MAKKKASEVSRARKVRSIERLTHDYFLRIGGELSEPLKIAQLWELYWEGRINEREPYWTDGLSEWRPIGELAIIGQLHPIAPPSQPSIFQRFFRHLTNAPEPAANVPDLPVPRSGKRCDQCNGPQLLT